MNGDVQVMLSYLNIQVNGGIDESLGTVALKRSYVYWKTHGQYNVKAKVKQLANVTNHLLTKLASKSENI